MKVNVQSLLKDVTGCAEVNVASDQTVQSLIMGFCAERSIYQVFNLDNIY